MIALPYMISFLTGTALLLRFAKEPKALAGLFFPAAFGLGMGLSALLTFYSFLIWNKFFPAGTIGLHVLLLLGLTVHKDFKPRLFTLGQEFCSSWPLGLLAVAAFPLTFMAAGHHPFGEWDAWAVWNVKTKFLIAGNWRDIFNLHWHTQPDYPWLLPAFNAWVHGFVAAPVHKIGQTTAVVFSVNTVLLLFTGLRRYINLYLALLAAAVLLFNPALTFLGTAQYADVVLAHYLLLAIIGFIVFAMERQAGIILGLSLGLMPFAKNEGVVIALLFLAVTFFFTADKKSFRGTVIAFGAAAAAFIIFKLFLAPANRDITLQAFGALPSLFSWERCRLIAEFFLREMFNPQWHYIWLLLAAMFVLNVKKYTSSEVRGLLVFFALYGAVIFVIYLTTMNFDLSWRLSRTVPRILFYLLPSFLFMAFYAEWKNPSLTKK